MMPTWSKNLIPWPETKNALSGLRVVRKAVLAAADEALVIAIKVDEDLAAEVIQGRRVKVAAALESSCCCISDMPRNMS